MDDEMYWRICNDAEFDMNDISEEEEQNKKKDEDKCEHAFIIDEHYFKVCTKCGEVHECIYQPERFEGCRQIKLKSYEKKKHFIELIRRLNGYFFVEKTQNKIIIEDMPKSLKDIRAFIRKNKLKYKNDFYYWRLKNNIKEIITNWCGWVLEYIKVQWKQTSRDFIVKKLISLNMCPKIVSVIQRKAEKKI